MLQSGDADEIVWPINESVRDFIISRGRLLHNMVNIVPFPGLSNIRLQVFERLWRIEIGFDKWNFVIKPSSCFCRRFQGNNKLASRSKFSAQWRSAIMTDAWLLRRRSVMASGSQMS